jgi:hypothetical protein
LDSKKARHIRLLSVLPFNQIIDVDFNFKKNMKKYLIIICRSNFEEKYATTNNYQIALKYALEAIIENEGAVIKIENMVLNMVS